MSMKLYRDLSKEEEAEFRAWVQNDERTQEFIRRLSAYHPVVRKEIINQIEQTLEGVE